MLDTYIEAIQSVQDFSYALPADGYWTSFREAFWDAFWPSFWAHL